MYPFVRKNQETPQSTVNVKKVQTNGHREEGETYFFDLSWRFLRSDKTGQFKFKLEKNEIQKPGQKSLKKVKKHNHYLLSQPIKVIYQIRDPIKNPSIKSS